ncbi:MAG: hypothetical protein A2636_04815 [Elusimicrobia bacterium RIFCSPHIGHO2_01_FULL_64_10]|nr:MAG: hypothetical protein A2636_04815 [Elusimicrobia bacterium RIFCSPHIGHO2_01_FULL_64_10]
MRTAIVVGGGWAGLSAATRLADRGWRVTVLEQSKRLGGRASSFTDPRTGQAVDNGQHLFMGCYSHTLDFLGRIGSLDRVRFQEDLRVDFVEPGGAVHSLKCPSLPAPLHLFAGVMGLDTLSSRDKLSMLRVWGAARRWSRGKGFGGVTVTEWLKGLGQSESARTRFWEPIVIATLNESPDVAQADSLGVVLKEGFLSGRKKSRIGIAEAGLSEVVGPPSRKYIEERGGKVLTDRLVTRISAVGDSVRGVVLRGGSTLTADLYVSALPFFVLRNVLAPEQARTPFFHRVKNLESSPIFSVSLWFDRAVTDLEFAGMLGTRMQWLFDKGRILKGPPGYVSLVLSAAREHSGKSNEEIRDMALEETRQCFPASREAKLLAWIVQKEKNATLSPRAGHAANRLPQKTPLRNFLLCGDWTETGFPATIESAVASGVLAAGLAGAAA